MNARDFLLVYDILWLHQLRWSVSFHPLADEVTISSGNTMSHDTRVSDAFNDLYRMLDVYGALLREVRVYHSIVAMSHDSARIWLEMEAFHGRI